MARDAEPVGPRTTRLLRSTANRRVSLLPIDAPAGAEEAATPWNINTEEQLFHWASNQPNEVINMLNELRSQRDLTLQLNEHWLLVQDDHKKRAEQLEAAFDKNDELEEKINQLQGERLNSRAERSAPMLITRLGQHQMILGKTWMNKTEVTIDMRDDRLQFPSSEAHIKASTKAHSTVLPSKKIAIEQKSSAPTQILKRSTPSVVTRLSEKSSPFSKIVEPPNSVNSASPSGSMNIAMIGAAAYRSLAKRSDVATFAITVTEIDRLLKTARNKLEDVNLQELSHEKTLEEVKAKLPSEYHDYLDVFDRAMADQLPPHRPYDHKIELIGEGTPPRSRLYHMSGYKLQKVKDYLIEHLNKGFISSSSASYASLILFAEKKDGSLRFCVDYRKLNALTKRDRYPLPLIDETLARIQGSRYLTRLDIIAAFNKLRMHPGSEDLTTFITSFDSYKYHVMPFELTNGSASYQQYMNDVLFDYLHQFCQAYLDDIIIYNKTLKKHKRHVRLVLHRLREADLQVNINKCEFHVQKTSFLRLLLFIEELKMNLRKVQAVVLGASIERVIWV